MCVVECSHALAVLMHYNTYLESLVTTIIHAQCVWYVWRVGASCVWCACVSARVSLTSAVSVTRAVSVKRAISVERAVSMTRAVCTA